MYPAHIRETGERQTVQEHCRNTAALAATALRPLGLEKSAYLAGLLHDAGKTKQEYAHMRNTFRMLPAVGTPSVAVSTTPSPACAFCWIVGTAAAVRSPIPT